MTTDPGARPRSVLVEADGGSRGNPGNAAYGAVLKDAETGRVLAERAERIGVASNNVAEYRGLIAGLELYREHADGAELEVRMDSKLVVEQMAGRWKIKHPSMRPLAIEANRLAPAGTRWTWIPRDQNKHADRLANLALDGPEGVVHGGPVVDEPRAPELDSTVTLVLVSEGDDVAVAATGQWLAEALARTPPVLLSSAGREALRSADVLGPRLGAAPVVEAALEEGPARLRDRLLTSHGDQVVVAVTGSAAVVAVVSSVLGVRARASLPVDLAPASVTVVALSAGGGVVRLLGGLPRIDLRIGAVVG